MRCPDVNVLVYGHRRDAPDHARYRTWLEAARTGDEALGVLDVVVTGFLRVVTHSRVFARPTPMRSALEFAQRLRSTPNAVTIGPGPRNWDVLTGLIRRYDVRGNLVPDAYIASVVLENGATLYSADRGFARFAELDWRHPLDADD